MEVRESEMLPVANERPRITNAMTQPTQEPSPAVSQGARELWWKTKVTVCDKCFQATCWQGKFMCDQAYEAGIVEKTVAELISLHTGEHPDHWGLNADSETSSLRAQLAEAIRERDELLASLPLSSNRTREEARKLLGEVLRHVTNEKLQASHGCVEVTNAAAVVDRLIGERDALRSQVSMLAPAAPQPASDSDTASA